MYISQEASERRASNNKDRMRERAPGRKEGWGWWEREATGHRGTKRLHPMQAAAEGHHTSGKRKNGKDQTKQNSPGPAQTGVVIDEHGSGH